MRLLAVVVLYHPGKDLTGNINSYLPQVDRLLGLRAECRHRYCAE